jgi:2-methylcitrate dehydratase PrpD
VSVARQLSELFCETRATEIPPRALETARMLVASTLASAALGSGFSSARIIRRLAQEKGGRPNASVWYSPHLKLPADEAAQVNAVQSAAAAYDDTHMPSISHFGTASVATTLAIGEQRGATGDDILAAIVCGYEAATRMSAAISPEFRKQGFNGCLVAIFAATVASGRLLELTAAQLANALALTATSIGGLKAGNMSDAREYIDGLSVTLGTNAALAASYGYCAREDIFESAAGFFALYGRADAAAAARVATQAYGERWGIVTDMAIKFAPGGHPYHAFGQAAGLAVRRGGISADEIDAITIWRPELSAGGIHPHDFASMIHSPAYYAAAGAADGELSWQHGKVDKLGDPTIRSLMEKVRVEPLPVSTETPAWCGASVAVRTRDGRVSTTMLAAPLGVRADGPDWHDVDGKYRALLPTAGVPSRAIEASLRLIHDFSDLTNVSELTDLLQTAGS